MDDFALPVTLTSLGGLFVAAVGWYIRERVAEVKAHRESYETEIEQHIKSCNDKIVSQARIEVRVEGLDEKIVVLETTTNNRFDRVDRGFESMESSIAALSNKITAIANQANLAKPVKPATKAKPTRSRK